MVLSSHCRSVRRELPKDTETHRPWSVKQLENSRAATQPWWTSPRKKQEKSSNEAPPLLPQCHSKSFLIDLQNYQKFTEQKVTKLTWTWPRAIWTNWKNQGLSKNIAMSLVRTRLPPLWFLFLFANILFLIYNQSIVALLHCWINWIVFFWETASHQDLSERIPVQFSQWAHSLQKPFFFLHLLPI